MGTITLINNTNVPINSSISAGVNHSWCNLLTPRTYYVHQGLGVFTLNTKYWMGSASEYSHNVDEIGLFAGAIGIGIVGLLLAPFTGGGSMLIAAGALSGASGLAVTGMALGVKDYRSQPASWTNIQSISNRVFVADAQVTLKELDGKVTYENIPDLKLREIDPFEFRRLISQGYVEHQENEGDKKLIINVHSTAAELRAAGLLDVPLRIFPSLGGDACWEIENDEKKDYARMQLWARNTPQVLWRIQPLGDNSTTRFRIYNKALERYVMGTTTTAEGSNMVFSVSKAMMDKFTKDDSCVFQVVKSRIERVKDTEEDFYAFINERAALLRPPNRADLAIVPESGNLGNSTKLIMGKLNDGRPSWKRWKLVKS